MNNNWDFRNAPSLDPDAIFAITAEAIAAGPQAINGTIGVVTDEQGKVIMFESVRKALADIGSSLASTSFSYPPLLGLPEFRSSSNTLIFGDATPPVAGIASTAGTGALALNLRLAKMMHEDATVILSTPAWANHIPICQANALHITEVPHTDASGKATIDPIIEAVKKATRPVVILLQVGCHNPTGLDIDELQWKELAEFLADHDCLVLMDFAYQGFKDSVEQDRWPVELFIKHKIPMLIAWSGSKNHSIYGARCGYACAVCPDDATVKKLEVNYSRITRGMHSAASIFGQMVIAKVQKDYREEWLKDIASARDTIAKKRAMMIEHLHEPFKTALSGFGMFAMLPLSVEQIRKLKTDHKIFFTEDGRINIAGIPLKRIEEMCGKMMAHINA